jgi:hypothetical protein
MKKYVRDYFKDGGERSLFMLRFFIWTAQKLGLMDRLQRHELFSGEGSSLKFDFEKFTGSLEIIWSVLPDEKAGHWRITCTSFAGPPRQTMCTIDLFVSGPNVDYPNVWGCVIDPLCVPTEVEQRAKLDFIGLSFLDGRLAVRGDANSPEWKKTVSAMTLMFMPGMFIEEGLGIVSLDLNPVRFVQPSKGTR